MAECEVCRRKGSEVRRCMRCLRVYYCSKECQKQDWPHHKLACTKPVSAQDQAAAATSGDQRQQEEGATGGHVTAPCSSDEPSDNRGPSTDSRCHNCGRTDQGLMKCARCKQVAYCSRDCQRQHWGTHKGVCGRPPASEAEGSGTEEDRRKELARSVMEEASRRMANAFVRHPVTPIMRLMWAGARARAERMYPGEVLVDRFNSLDSDMPFLSPFPRRVVLVCLMREVYYHWFRHGRTVEDVEGLRMHVLFYNEQDPEPFFSYEQLREGNFLCLSHALVHGFLDGTVGLRVDDPSHVRVIELGCG